ncbi:D-Ala-D-Ala carboxypeptidase family metallohydrolase [Methylophaga lonarensis]|uniref:D-Ala-D-Ala carboxypeptidase family metallohydrolase n=1 Tax=Methylophaga lonarensis TaxID=999151 RepID=UPI003D2D966E
MQLSANFWRSEFACKCGCGFDTVDAELIPVLQSVRDYFNSPVTVTSGARCVDHNRRVGGAARSQHLFGRAADIQVQGHSPKEVQDWLVANYEGRLGIGFNSRFTHIDTRNNAARFNY